MSETGPGGYTASAWSCVKNGGATISGKNITLDLAMDGNGSLWRTDTLLNYLGRFELAQAGYPAFDPPPNLDSPLLTTILM